MTIHESADSRSIEVRTNKGLIFTVNRYLATEVQFEIMYCGHRETATLTKEEADRVAAFIVKPKSTIRAVCSGAGWFIIRETRPGGYDETWADSGWEKFPSRSVIWYKDKEEAVCAMKQIGETK